MEIITLPNNEFNMLQKPRKQYKTKYATVEEAKEAQKQKMKEWREKNRDKQRENLKKWKEDNRALHNEYQRIYQAKNSEIRALKWKRTNILDKLQYGYKSKQMFTEDELRTMLAEVEKKIADFQK